MFIALVSSVRKFSNCRSCSGNAGQDGGDLLAEPAEELVGELVYL
ncbi:hypothetical protein [Nocardia yunnanensis]|nr:hypothetical protein [Nocardia yunnanensis]